MPEEAITYLVTTTMTPEELKTAGCSDVSVAVLTDHKIVLANRGPRTMQEIADVLELSEYRRLAMPEWDSLEPVQQRDILAAATLTGVFAQPQMVIEWLDNQDMWDWLLPSQGWRHEVEDTLTDVKMAGRSPAVVVVIDTSCRWKDGSLTTCLLQLQQCLTSTDVSRVLLTEIDQHFMAEEDVETERIHEFEPPETVRGGPESYFKHATGEPPDLVIYLSEEPSNVEDVKPNANTIWLTPDDMASASAA